MRLSRELESPSFITAEIISEDFSSLRNRSTMSHVCHRLNWEEIMQMAGLLSKRRVIILELSQCPALPVSRRWDHLPSLPKMVSANLIWLWIWIGISPEWFVSNQYYAIPL